MHLASLEVVDFRSWEHVRVELTPGMTVLLGPNGYGKTNLLEAVYYLASGGSHRVAGDDPLVRRGAARAMVRTQAVRDGRAATVEIEITPGRSNRARVNSASVPARRAIGIVRAVLIAPEDLALVRGEPEVRRRMLDDLLVARAPRWSLVRRDYDRALRQRNMLLKSARPGHRSAELAATLDAWDAQLAQAGAELTVGRLALLAELHPHVLAAHTRLAGAHPVRIDYRSAWGESCGPHPDPGDLRTALQDQLTALRSREIERGATLAGPHRDDVELVLDERPVRGYASHGESWTMALALRIGAFDLLRADGEEPVLLLDDVFAELDADRRVQLAELSAGAEQALITASVRADVPDLPGAGFQTASPGGFSRAS